MWVWLRVCGCARVGFVCLCGCVVVGVVVVCGRGVWARGCGCGFFSKFFF